MDIFTTQLAQVLPVPIKPEKLKVKALSKDASMRPLEEDITEFESDVYVSSKNKEGQQQSTGQHGADQSEPQLQQNTELQLSNPEPSGSASTLQAPKKGVLKQAEGTKPLPKHLDIYV